MPKHLSSTVCLLLAWAFLLNCGWAADTLTETPEEIQGEYAGEITMDNVPVRIGVQVIARGGDAYHAVGYVGGLPGDGWSGVPKHEADGFFSKGQVEFSGEGIASNLRGGVLTITTADGKVLGQLKRVNRESKTLGMKPPAGAVVLFDGTSVDQFEVGKLTDDKLLAQGAVTKQKFGSYKLHLEFMLPFMPQASGQGRGNSGCYNQGRYEVQILDSFGLAGADNECGGIYQIKAPTANLCYPPLAWQTYDITFTAAKYDADGKKTSNAKISVEHNGFPIHHNLELPHATPGGIGGEAPEPGPLYLQDHGDPVRFRNIWIIETK